jgi:hypothetical protein
MADKESAVPVYDPRGIVDVTSRPLAPRIKDINGLRLGILDNTKWNGNKLLRAIRDELAQQYNFKEVNYYRKQSFSHFAQPDLVKEIAANNDVLLTAIGD